MPDGISYTVERKGHPLRKIWPQDKVEFHILDEKSNLVDRIRLTGYEIRKKGLGKDVTNKTLNGLPGIQKEGCDGIITSAVFILYPEYKYKKTCCIEFFGNDMTEAGKVIAAIFKGFVGQDLIQAGSCLKEPCLKEPCLKAPSFMAPSLMAPYSYGTISYGTISYRIGTF
jgi:hypothetical protein